MKKFTIITLLFFLVVQVGQAQKKYSRENLEKASQEELNTYLDKAMKLQKTGRTFNIVGGVSYGAVAVSAILGSDWVFGVDSWALIVMAGGGIIVGTTSFAIGIPTNLTGKRRVEQINEIKGTAFHEGNIELSPCIQYNLNAQNYQPGVALRFGF
ncbi:hypothetical protein E9993_14955 [Labilibacter sediminis]|nr:hypothetical protein E9993_14955 [Labilibacter sediminis]